MRVCSWDWPVTEKREKWSKSERWEGLFRKPFGGSLLLRVCTIATIRNSVRRQRKLANLVGALHEFQRKVMLSFRASFCFYSFHICKHMQVFPRTARIAGSDSSRLSIPIVAIWRFYPTIYSFHTHYVSQPGTIFTVNMSKTWAVSFSDMPYYFFKNIGCTLALSVRSPSFLE